jgi:hypothetical protein
MAAAYVGVLYMCTVLLPVYVTHGDRTLSRCSLQSDWAVYKRPLAVLEMWLVMQ